MENGFPWIALCLAMVSVGTMLDAPASRAADEGAPVDAEIVRRSLVSAGDTARLQHAMAKARRGATVTVGVMGGSITQGAKASDAAHRYADLVARWWREKFPLATVKFVNAGIGATGSNYGALRVKRDLLVAQPDFVIVEYAVNDPNLPGAAETLEGVVRQVLGQPHQPALLLLFMMNRSGKNAQEWFAKVGEHYRLPMVSYRDALWPEIEAKRLTWEAISPDEVHPNDRGHAAAARFVTSLLESVFAALPADEKLPPVAPLPAPRFTDLYERTALWEATALQPHINNGWVYEAAGNYWKSDQPGSAIEFLVEGRTFFTMHYVVRGPMGRARVSVDGAAPVTLEGWFEPTWGGYRQTNRIAHDLAPGQHRVRFELLPEKSQGSEGHEFRILGLGAAGLEAR